MLCANIALFHVQNINNLRLATDDELHGLNWAFVTEAAVEVVVHVSVVVMLPCVLFLAVGGYAQHMYSISVGSRNDPFSATELFLSGDAFDPLRAVALAQDGGGTGAGYAGTTISLFVAFIWAAMWCTRLLIGYWSPGVSSTFMASLTTLLHPSYQESARGH